MHELSIAEGILSTIEERLGKIMVLSRVNLIIGPLAGVSAESLEFWFSEVAQQKGFGTPVLNIQKTKALALCSSCGLQYEVHSFYSGCPDCASLERSVTAGFECNIESVELEDDDHV